jgi:hypothetical protein
MHGYSLSHQKGAEAAMLLVQDTKDLEAPVGYMQVVEIFLE